MLLKMSLLNCLKIAWVRLLIVGLGVTAFSMFGEATTTFGKGDSGKPVIHGPDLIGAPLNSPFVLRVPVTGRAPLTFLAQGLPQGLNLDPQTGIISGTPLSSGAFDVQIRVQNSVGHEEKSWHFVVGPRLLALTPVMGWNSWYVWGCQVSDQKIRQAADLLVSSGLADHGYNYINIDDCWQGSRNAQGEITSNQNFPDMKDLADYIHSKGLKIGIYTSPGAKTCQKYEGSKGHEEQDLLTYSKWEMDFVKYDWCSFRGDYVAPYLLMGDLIDQAPRAMVYSLCQYGMDEVWAWGKNVHGNMWRTSDDLVDSWASVLRNGFGQAGLSRFAGPGYFNDPDMLMIGYASWGAPGTAIHKTNLTSDEQRTHFSLWSLMSAPLLISSDLNQLDAETLQFLTNDEVLALDQDAFGVQADKISDENGIQVWKKPLQDGSTALGFFNMTSFPLTINLHKDLENFMSDRLSSNTKVRDLWAHVDLTFSNKDLSLQIPPHGVSLLKIIPQK